MLGIHVWEKRKFDKYDPIMHAVCLLSILSWKKFHGKIHLYTNESYLQDLEQWGIDKYYDKIDLEKLKEIPKEIDQKEYWAWGKLQVAKSLKPPFVLVDNDLWLNEPLELPINNSFTGYHYEKFDRDYGSHTYPDFDDMIPEKYLGRWKKWIMSVNMGLCLINSKPLLDKWIECAEEIAKHKSPKFAHPSAKICFVEQRLLPMIAYELGLNWGTFIDPIYNTHLVEMQNGSEWTPNFNEWTPEMLSEFIKIKHVWGLKNYFENENIRSMVINNVLSTFEMYPKEKEKHSDLLEEIKSFLLETSKEE
jgi:hypothetical protein